MLLVQLLAAEYSTALMCGLLQHTVLCITLGGRVCSCVESRSHLRSCTCAEGISVSVFISCCVKLYAVCCLHVDVASGWDQLWLSKFKLHAQSVVRVLPHGGPARAVDGVKSTALPCWK